MVRSGAAALTALAAAPALLARAPLLHLLRLTPAGSSLVAALSRATAAAAVPDSSSGPLCRVL